MRTVWSKRFLVFLLVSVMLLSNLVYAAPENSAGTASSDKQLEKKLDEYLGILAKNGAFRGVVLVTKDGRTIYEKAYGKACEEHNVSNKNDTKFEIGSVTKQFTAASVLMLAQQNKLDVTDKLSKYIPDYPNGDKITIHNLLAQNSGIAEHTSEIMNPDFNPAKKYKPEDIIALFKYKPLSFEPGEKFQYCNSNYILLGYIIEKVSGKSWAQYVTDNIIGPLKLTNTGFTDRQRVVNNLAQGYTTETDGIRRCGYIDGSFPYAAGQIYSNAQDLAKWNEALFSNKVLDADYTTKMLTKYVKMSGDQSYYGYGVMLQKDNGRDVAWHPGDIFGFSACWLRYVDAGTNIIVLSNNDCTNTQEICFTVGHIYNNDKYELPKL